MRQRIKRLQRQAPHPTPTPEDNARAIVEVCRAVMALIDGDQLVDGPNGLTIADGPVNYWDVCEVRDKFVYVVASWWWNSGMGDRPAGVLDREAAYQLAENIATTLERGLSGE